jgi:nickel-dependent lactate racemase
MKLEIPYYRGTTVIDVADSRIKAVLKPRHPENAVLSERETVISALENPIGSPPLSRLAVGKSNILVITSDHTRPVPSRITMPLLLSGIRRGNPNANVKILIATGFHRATTPEELADKFGKEICGAEDIVVHDAFDKTQTVYKGPLPSGGSLWVNRLVDWADLVVSEGFIEPHFFAGFSGGRKSILPGICSHKTIMYNHNARYIADPRARTGVLEGNPLHEDMLFAARAAGLSFILNVALDANKKVVSAFAGDPFAAHEAGCASVRQSACVKAVRANLVVSSNGGYPLDQNIYQTVKGMTAAEACLNEGGVIIMLSSCANGHGGEGFYRWFKDAASPEEVLQKIAAIPPADTLPDQWEAQILARVLQKCKKAIIVSQHADPKMIEDMHMLHAATFDRALEMADLLLGGKEEMVIIPDGVGVIVEELK